MSTTLLLSLSRYVDCDGKAHWVEILPEVAEVLASIEPPLRERLLREPKNLECVPDRKAGFSWEGPRYAFTWLIGESRTWAGESWLELDGQVYCGFCLGSKLPTHAYCLQCDRSGRDELIRGPSQGDLEKRVEPRRVYRPRGKLRGGRGDLTGSES